MSPPAQKRASPGNSRSDKRRDTVSVTGPKGTQRERLVRAMIELSAESGYHSVSVAQVSSRAGVSSATFYTLFDDKEDCLLAAYRAARARVFKQMLPAVADPGWSDAARHTLGGLFGGLQSDPDVGRVLFVESLAGGPRVRAARERALGQYEHSVQDFLDHAPGDGETLDIPVAALVGALRHIVAWHLRTHSEDRLPTLVEDVLAWMGAYAVPAGAARWSTGAQSLLARAPTRQPPAALDASEPWPERLPRGRHGLPVGVVTRSQRRRIVAGTAEVMVAKGYASATVSDIVAAAGISRDVFYRHFADKQNAFLEAQQYATQHIFNTCAAAYFSAADWPQRVCSALDALLGLIAANPAIAHLRIVECYAAGPAAIRSTEELLRAATVFLEEGYGYRPQARALPRLCSHAVTGAVFEVIYREVARGLTTELPRHLPQLTYIVLSPFTGGEEAIRLVTQMCTQEAA